MHNRTVMKLTNISCFVVLLGFFALPLAFAQDAEPAGDDDDSSERVEQRDDSYRRQMELEDARSRDRTYIDNTYSQTAELEKIDKLPEESRDNIRDQLVDVIMENGDWKPGDVLEEYPYQPTETAEADPELKEQEQAAWDEQIEKYHEREAAAFGAYRGPVPGPGNPTGQEGGQQGEGSEGQQGGEQCSGQGGGQGESGSGSAGTYQPYESSASGSGDEVSTAGVSESALDFLRGGQAQENQEQAAEQNEEQAGELAQAEPQEQSSPATQQDLRGIIAIEDLDKLEGMEIPIEPVEPEDR